MLRGFVCCNGLLDRDLVTNANGRGIPGASLLPLRSGASRRRVASNQKNQSRSRCPPRRPEGRRRRVAYNLTTRSRSRWLVTRAMGAFQYTRPSRTEPQHIELMPRFEALGAHPQKSSFADVWARANVLAFSCERT